MRSHHRTKLQTMVEDLAQKFHSVSEDDQRALLTCIMPAVCRLFRKDPEAMMEEMMPLGVSRMKRWRSP